MFGEFNLIDKYFSARQTQRKDVHLALGDDCAIVKAPEGVRIAISTDTLYPCLGLNGVNFTFY